MENNKKRKKWLVIAVVILSILLIGLSGYICYDIFLRQTSTDKQKENTKIKNDDTTKNNEKTENSITIDNSANLDFDFEELSNTLHSSIQSGNLTPLVSKCETKEAKEDEIPEIESKNISVSEETIDYIITKLKSAKSIDKDITYSWFGCPPNSITYYISVNSNDQSLVHSQNVFSLNYADGDDILLVGYNQKGYAFNFNSNEEINNFIESLK